MTPIKSILVPVDFSQHSAAALDYAVDLARHYDASLELLHVYEPIAYALPENYVLISPEQLDEVLERFRIQLEAEQRRALAAGASRVTTTLSQGLVRSEILRVASEHKPGLIVMGTRGRTGLKHMFLGSVAEAVIRGAACPVLSVRASTSN